MDSLIIRGGRPLRGEIEVLGAKNACLLIQCAALLSNEPSTLRHVPQLTDVVTMNHLLEALGCEIHTEAPRTLHIDPRGVASGRLEAPYELVKTMRAAVTVMGPLVARYGRARVSLPGGCAIGARPIDQHLKGLAALGADVRLEHGYVEVSAKRLRGATFVFDKVTVGGTQNLMMAAALAQGTSVLENVAREPEVVELAVFINKMGGRISGAGGPVIEVEGVETLSGAEHAVMADRIEAGTLAVAAAITRGEVALRHAPVDAMHAILAKLREAGAACTVRGDNLHVRGPDRLEPLELVTAPHPGFPTDMQAQFMVLAAAAQGTSTVREQIFENRFMHVPELVRMGARIAVSGSLATVRGPTPLGGTTVMATDLRASASLVLAGLIAEGSTEIRRVYHLDRGYERLERRLAELGASVERVAGAPM